MSDTDELKRQKNRESQRRWRQKNPERCREYQRKWRQKNLEHCREYQNSWREKNKDYCREYRRNYVARRKEADPEFAEKLKSYHRKYEAKRKRTDPEYVEHLRTYQREYQARRRRTDPDFVERRRESNRRWSRNNPEVQRERYRRYRYQKKISQLYRWLAESEDGIVYLYSRYDLTGHGYPMMDKAGYRPEDYFVWDEVEQRMIDRTRIPREKPSRRRKSWH